MERLQTIYSFFNISFHFVLLAHSLICKSDSRSDWTDTILVLVVALVIAGEQSH